MITRPYAFIAFLSSAAVLMPLRAQAQTPTPGEPPAPSSSTASAPRVAGAFDPAGTRFIADPLYLPMKGQVYGMTAFSLDQPHGENWKNGVSTGSFAASDDLTTQTLAYGLLADLSVHLAFDYRVNQRDSTAATTGDVTTGNSSGFSDPTIGATVRLLDEPRSPLILDLAGSYSPNALASKTAGGGSDGTIARGGQAAGLSVALGRETNAFTLAGTAAITYVGQQATELLASSTATDSAAHWSYSGGLATQTRFTARVSLDAGVAFATAGSYGVSNADTGKSHTYNPAVTRTLDLALNYGFWHNRLVAAVTYAYNNYTESTSTFAKPASDTAVVGRAGNVIGVRLMYLFN